MKVMPRTGDLPLRMGARTLRLEEIMCSGRHRLQLKQLSVCQPLLPLIQLLAVTQIVLAYHYHYYSVAGQVQLFWPLYHRLVLPPPFALCQSLSPGGHRQLRKSLL